MGLPYHRRPCMPVPIVRPANIFEGSFLEKPQIPSREKQGRRISVETPQPVVAPCPREERLTRFKTAFGSVWNFSR